MSFSSLRGQFLRFILVGSLNFCLNTAVLNLLAHYTHIYSGPAVSLFSAIAFAVTVTSSYLFNRNWTFKASGRNVISYPMFCALTLLGFGISNALIFTISTYVRVPHGVSPALWLNFANCTAAGFGLFWNFTAYRHIVFRRPAAEPSAA
jgi:putative flippase GtrA